MFAKLRPPAFWQRNGPIAAALSPIGSLYALCGRLKAASTRRRSVAVPVICIGNITSGGAGKTPTAIAIADLLAASGRRPWFLSRGYGGSLKGPLTVEPARHEAAEVGDEPLLLGRVHPAVVARERWQGAALAVTEGADVIVMDDGFQNRSLRKDLSFLVVDAAQGFANGRVIPAGPLREPLSQGLARADAVVLVHNPGQDRRAALPPFGVKPVFAARIVAEPASLPPGNLVAFAGIAHPEKLFGTLRALGHAALVLRQEAEDKKAHLVTTEKDLVRIAPAARDGIAALPVRLLFDEAARLQAFIEEKLHNVSP